MAASRMRCPPGRTPDRLARQDQVVARRTINACNIPFSTTRLDGLLDDAGIDVLIVTSKHNIQYLLGGYYHFQFDYMEAIGISRYLPIFVYVKGAPGQVGLYRQPERAGQRPEPNRRRLLDAAGRVRIVHLGRGDDARARAYQGCRDVCASCRRRAVVPAGRRGGCAAQGAPGLPARRGDAAARETAVDQDRGRAGDSPRGVRACGRVDDGRGRAVPAPDKASARSSIICATRSCRAT